MMTKEDEKRIEAQVLAALHPLCRDNPAIESAIRASVQQTIALLHEEAFIHPSTRT